MSTYLILKIWYGVHMPARRNSYTETMQIEIAGLFGEQLNDDGHSHDLMESYYSLTKKKKKVKKVPEMDILQRANTVALAIEKFHKKRARKKVNKTETMTQYRNLCPDIAMPLLYPSAAGRGMFAELLSERQQGVSSDDMERLNQIQREMEQIRYQRIDAVINEAAPRFRQIP